MEAQSAVRSPAGAKRRHQYSKTKFSCQACNANIWGKADTNMICGTCYDQNNSIVRMISESWLRKSEQGDKWSFCLTAVKINPRIRRDDEQTSTPDAHTGI